MRAPPRCAAWRQARSRRACRTRRPRPFEAPSCPHARHRHARRAHPTRGPRPSWARGQLHGRRPCVRRGRGVRRGGVLRRRGHTEAAVDLARLAGLAPAG
ncbi:3,4-dihydroxy-2-butanone-4-phosphate synthase, partial [Actinomadura rugatobispora]